MIKLIYFIPILLLACDNNSIDNKKINSKSEIDTNKSNSKISFDEQYKVFESLGYRFNEGVTKDSIFKEMTDSDLTLKNPDSIFVNAPFSELYYYLGWYSGKNFKFNTNNCIWMDLEFIDDISSYEIYMRRMGLITNGELTFTDISTYLSDDGYEYILFKVNGSSREWKLEKEGYISEEFLPNFSLLAKEFATKGNYTIYNNGGQQFVIDFMTSDELVNFKKLTGLEVIWLNDLTNEINKTKEADSKL